MAILAFQKPDKVVMLEADDKFGKFEFRPLEPGFGVTIGNALRRILLSSLEGYAINTIRISGVEHEFSSVPGVKEDVTNIILNLKQVRFKQVVEEFENEKVGKDDKVFVLGDFVLRRGKSETAKIINQLNGDIYLVPGNHDKVEAYAGCDKNRFHVCSDITYLRLRPENKDDERFKHSEYILVLSHFPQLCYSHSEKNNTYNLFGHIHSRYNMPMSDYGTPLRLRIGKQFDVGTDRNNYAPVNIFDVMRQIKEYEFWNLHNNI